MARRQPFISRVRLTNYKSIAHCDVRLGALTILVGANGSGKSNFLDALAFLARAVETTPNEAIEERGGLEAIIRRVPTRADSFSIKIDGEVPWDEEERFWAHATYGFEVALEVTRHWLAGCASCLSTTSLMTPFGLPNLLQVL